MGCADLVGADFDVHRRGQPSDASVDAAAARPFDVSIDKEQGDVERDASVRPAADADANGEERPDPRDGPLEDASLWPDGKNAGDASDDVDAQRQDTGAPDVDRDIVGNGQPDAIDATDTAEGGWADASDDGRARDADARDSCATGCPRLDDLRCSDSANAATSRQVQVCSLVNGCLEWVDSTLCNDDAICCDGICRDIASPSSCEGDYYVDAVNGTDSLDAGVASGSETRPFRTITFAIRRAEAGAPGRRIHVRAGQYDDALGETFPIVLRHGHALLGAGANLVTIKGAGSYDHAGEGGPFNGQYQLTLLVGDSTRPTVVSGVTLRGALVNAVKDYDGLFCDRGNAPASDSIAGATILDDVVAGPGYDVGVLATASTAPVKTGCNLRMTRSTVTGGYWGVVAAGCLQGTPRVPVSAQIGNASVGNSFSGLKSPPEYNTGAILFWPCASNSSVRHNTITDSEFGVAIDQRSDIAAGVGGNTFTISNNTFSDLSIGGVFVFNELSAIQELSDNTFTNISASLGDGVVSMGIGLALGGNGAFLPPVKARRNRFVGNDAGITVGGSRNVNFDVDRTIDFGRPDDPGSNVFRCNSTSIGVAGDILIDVSGTGAIQFAGNVWDHSPVTTGVEATAVNGTDIILQETPNPAIDTTNGTVDTSSCPAGRIKGP